MESLKPVKRSSTRIYFGKKYYRLKRYIDWFIGKKKFSIKKSNPLLQHVIFTHQTLLLRELKDVDMWLQQNKVKNLKVATNKLDKVIVKPGEKFSYWCLLGKTTRRKGYVDGMVLHYGKVTTGVGGGLCQLSNLIYWMTLHSPLTVTERYRIKQIQGWMNGETTSSMLQSAEVRSNLEKRLQDQEEKLDMLVEVNKELIERLDKQSKSLNQQLELQKK
ncbi:VanW family protein [Bacillus sp. FJAT-49705]|uniref:VanW family protein n=1 Tax=Cytobacillus citreus TaxID=2833586 RepID=A0ABS5NVV2_9BACI|nr:VanW family protein [Cytobacillus citreus]MBS4191957.1 VanW family protein [Cytobacillus citreus]